MKNFPEAKEICDLIFQRVFENKGKIKKILWQNGELFFWFEECFPEEIIFDKAACVSYKNGSANFEAKISVKKEENSDESIFTIQEIQQTLKKSLLKTGTFLLNEEFDENYSKIKFFVDRENLKNAIESFCKTLENYFWHESEILFCPKQNGFEFVVKSIPGIKSDSSILSLILSYKEIFEIQKTEKLLTTVKKNVIKKTLLSTKKLNIVQKLGEIKKNGKIFVFVRFNDGKISLQEM